MKCAIQPFLAVERIVGTDAGALTLVKPLPAKAVARRPRFTRAKRPRPQCHRQTDGLQFKTMRSLLEILGGHRRNSIEPQLTCHRRDSDNVVAGATFCEGDAYEAIQSCEPLRREK